MDEIELIKTQLKALSIFDAHNVCMTVSECAQFLKKHQNTIKKQIHKGVIKASLIGNTWSIPKLQFLEELIDNYEGELPDGESRRLINRHKRFGGISVRRKPLR